jgi:AAA domain
MTRDVKRVTREQLLGLGVEVIEEPSQNGHVPNGLAVSAWAEIEERETMWLKDQEIPLGELTLLTGRGDLGKTTLEIDWLSAASRGRMSDKPVRVLHIAEGEVGAERAKAMLRAAGADGSMITFDKPRSLMTIPEDVPRLVATIKRRAIGLVAFDNLEAHVDLGGGDPYSENTIRRRVINPLRFCAQETGIAIVGIKHPPKAGGGHAHDLFGGSAAWINASRSGFLVRSDPDQQDRRVRLLLHVKGNLARGLVDTREFRLVSSLYVPNVPVIAWGDERPEVTLENFDAETFRDQLGLLIKGAVRAEPLGPAKVAKILPDFTPAAIKKRMQRMGSRGELKRHEGGKYGLPA